MKNLVRSCVAVSTLALLCVAAASAQKPDLIVQTGHSDSINSIAFSPDGATLASASGDHMIKLWQVATGREVRTLAGHTGSVNSIAFSPDGKMLVSGSSDKTIKFWDVSSGRTLQTLTVQSGGVEAMALSRDGQLLVAATSTGPAPPSPPRGAPPPPQFVEKSTVQLWDVTTRRELRTLLEVGAGDEIRSVAFSPDGKIVASSGPHHTVQLWDLASGDTVMLRPGGGLVTAIAFSADGKSLASNSAGTVNFWDLATRTPRKLAGYCSWVSGALAFSPDSKLFVCSSEENDNAIQVWTAATGVPLHSLVGHTGAVYALAFSSDGKALASGSSDRSLKLWDVNRGLELPALAGYGGSVEEVAFSPDSKMLAARDVRGFRSIDAHAQGKEESAIRLWDLGSGGGGLLGISQDRGLVGALAFSSNGSTLMSGSMDQGIKLWNVADLQRLPIRIGNDAYFHSFLALSRNWRTIATSSSEVELWDMEKKIKLQTIGVGMIESAAFSPDGGTLATGSWWGFGRVGDNTVNLWNVASGHQLKSLAGHTSMVKALTFSHDGTILASGDVDQTIRIWGVVNRAKNLSWVAHPGPIKALAFSPDDQFLVSASDADPAIKVWNYGTGHQLQILLGHTSGVNTVAFSNDKRILASGSSDGSIRLWDARSGNPIASLFALEGYNWVVADPDDRFDTNNLDEIKGLSWVFPDEPLRALPPEIFTREYYQPKLLKKLLSGEKLPVVRPLSGLNRAQPIVEVVKVELESAGEVSVSVKVSSTHSEAQKDTTGKHLESGAFDLRLFRDGQMVGQWPASQSAETSVARAGSSSDLESWQKAHEMALASGEDTHTFHHVRLPQRAGVDKVKFTAYAFNSDRVKSLTSAPLEYSLPQAAKPPLALIRRAYLISIGVNANQSGWNMDFAVPSAQDAARLLQDKLAKDYKVVPISLFSTLAPDSPQVVLKDATKANLKVVLDLLAGRSIRDAVRHAVDPDHKIQPATPDDAVVLFISSHGYADPQGTFYVVPYDTGTSLGVTEDALTRCQAHAEDRSPACERANAFLERTISSQDFTGWWAGVDAGEMVMILDSCHSAAVPGREFRPAPLGDAGFGQLGYDKRMRILSATQPDKTARATLVQELGHSLLVEALIEEAKAHPQESLAEWLHDTERQVPVLTHKLYPELSDADVQLPQLFDFAVNTRQ